MNARILSLATAAAIAIASLGATAPASAAPLGAAGQALTGQANDLVIEVGHKGKWKGKKGKWGKKWKKGKHFKFHFGGFHPSHYPHWCWENVVVKTKYGYIEKTVFICH